MKLIFLAVFLMLASCGKAAEDKHEKLEPTDPVAVRYEFASSRLVAEFLDQGFVVSRKPDNSPEHKGDSLIWSGVAMASLDCEKGSEIEDALIEMITDLDGGLYRHPDLPDQISMDGALGLYHGIAYRIANCDGALDRWQEPMRKHRVFLALKSGRLNNLANVKLPAEFTYIRDLLFHKFNLGGEPSKDRLKILEGQLYAWASAVMLSKSACFRLHLSYLSFSTIEKLGVGISRGGRGNFCAVIKGADLPLLDHWCGQDGLISWLDSFEVDVYEYRHQRCGKWESPDGNGNRTPGVDFLKGIEEAYNI